jgi:ATP-dependent helicase YprA (DUF1998 family)
VETVVKKDRKQRDKFTQLERLQADAIANGVVQHEATQSHETLKRIGALQPRRLGGASLVTASSVSPSTANPTWID